MERNARKPDGQLQDKLAELESGLHQEIRNTRKTRDSGSIAPSSSGGDRETVFVEESQGTDLPGQELVAIPRGRDKGLRLFLEKGFPCRKALLQKTARLVFAKAGKLGFAVRFMAMSPT